MIACLAETSRPDALMAVTLLSDACSMLVTYALVKTLPESSFAKNEVTDAMDFTTKLSGALLAR